MKFQTRIISETITIGGGLSPRYRYELCLLEDGKPAGNIRLELSRKLECDLEKEHTLNWEDLPALPYTHPDHRDRYLEEREHDKDG